MFSAFEWMVALRYLRARRQEGFISVIAWFSLMGIALGVATLIIVMSVMNGFRAELMGRILGLNGHLNVFGVESSISDYEAMAKQVSSIKGVVQATPTVEGQVMVTARGVARGALVRGVSVESLKNRAIIRDNIVSGGLDALSGDVPAVMIGAPLARALGLRVGDSLTLISPKGNVTAFGSVPRMRSYPIAATFKIGMHEYDSTFIFMPLPHAQSYFRLPGKVNSLEVFLDDPDSVYDVGKLIRKQVKGAGRMHDWQRANASFFNAIQVERNVMFLILTLIILVAAFNVVSSLIMLVKDKGRDIAILRTMGATRGTIMRIFFIAGASVGVIGTFLGFVLGLSFAANIEGIRQWIQGMTGTELFAAEIYFLSQLPARVDPVEVTAIVLMGLGLSLLATVYPSWRAARIDPAEALRYE